MTSNYRRPRPQVYREVYKPQTRYRRPKTTSKPPVIIEEPRNTENRRHYDTAAPKGESTSLMRSILGVTPFCVHDDAQFSCTFTPMCWMQGGVAMSGCDSMLYSCCVSHTIARRQVRETMCLFCLCFGLLDYEVLLITT